MDNLKEKFDNDGYVIFRTSINSDILDAAVSDMNAINGSRDKKLNPDIYHYNNYPRLIEAWKKSDAIKNIALDGEILSSLERLYGAKPIPFSTIN